MLHIHKIWEEGGGYELNLYLKKAENLMET